MSDHQNSFEQKSAQEWVELTGRIVSGINRANQIEKVIFQMFDSLELLGDISQSQVWGLTKTSQGTHQLTSTDTFVAGNFLSPGESCARLESILKTSFLQDPEFRKGIHRILVGTNVFYVAVVGEPSCEAYVAAWSFVGGEIKGNTPLGRTMELAVSQAQSVFKWLQKLDRTEALIYRDDLTGLYNSRFLEDSLDREIRRAGRFQSAFSLLFLDLDNFKGVNDQYGHLTGSDILKQFGDLLRATLRDIDSIVRYGGDEFVIILLGTGSAAGMLAGDRIRKAVAAHAFSSTNARKTIKLTCSIGVASYPEHASTKDELLRLADECMYKSKKKGKNRVTLFSEVH